MKDISDTQHIFPTSQLSLQFNKRNVMLSTQHNLLTMAWMYQLLICPPTLHHLHNIKCYLSQTHNLDTIKDQTWNSHYTISVFYELWKLPTTRISNTLLLTAQCPFTFVTATHTYNSETFLNYILLQTFNAFCTFWFSEVHLCLLLNKFICWYIKKYKLK